MMRECGQSEGDTGVMRECGQSEGDTCVCFCLLAVRKEEGGQGAKG